ncbi:amidase-like isoform X3 [Anneissia japonica]|uniref:amidase-like isoform X3 n=1 Tax=Anneissia japonica TaxID=1529436 RepID=UPI0014258B08|nr:amidase-like isoform X3 [Anneissia japonica]
MQYYSCLFLRRMIDIEEKGRIMNKYDSFLNISGDLYSSPSVRMPDIKKVEELSRRIGINLSDEEVKEYRELMKTFVESFNAVENIPEPTLPVKYPRLPGYRPPVEENPLNAWYWKTNIEGVSEGILKGKSVAIKDNVAVYGVPMMGGSWVLEGYIPEFDATVVTRILDAGGVIKGKSICEDFCCFGMSFNGARGPVLNPYNNTHDAGGSSSGSAVLVANGEVDMAIGGDQGGSIRLPASCCGIVGLKPTYGLVPYTGAQSVELTIDHLGPMAKTVYDCALLLEAIAGYDNGLDPRQPANVSVEKYTEELASSDLTGFTIGILKEGFEHRDSDPRVNELILQCISKVKVAHTEIKDVSVPMHTYGVDLVSCIACVGGVDTIFRGGSNGSGRKGFYSTSMRDAVVRGVQSQPNELSPSVKLKWMVGEYMKHEYRGKYYGKAQNLARLLTAEFDKVFQDVDVIVMPTIPFPPKKIPKKDASISALLGGWRIYKCYLEFCIVWFSSLTENSKCRIRKSIDFAGRVIGRYSNVLNTIDKLCK